MEFEVQNQTLRYHRGMLADDARTDAFRRAIEEVVQPGDVVLDLGTGTGILAMFAARAGARHVYAIEQFATIRLARELVAANGLTDVVTLEKGLSLDIELPERADVLVSETLWNFGLGEGIVAYVADARERLLKPDARVIPAAVTLLAAPAEVPEAYAELSWPEERYGVSLAPAQPYARNNLYEIDVGDGACLLAPGAELDEIDLVQPTRTDAVGAVSFVADRDATMHGLVGWFDSRLSPGVTLTNAPPKPTPSWKQTLMPLERPLEVRAGDRIDVRIETGGNATTWRWRTQVGGTVLDQSTVWGFPLGHKALAPQGAG